MGEQRHAGQRGTGTVGRRGLLGGVAALVAAGLARASEKVAEAADGQPLLLGRANAAGATTQLSRTGAAGGWGLRVLNSTGPPSAGRRPTGPGSRGGPPARTGLA